MRQGLTKCLQAAAVDPTERSFGTGQLKLTVTPWPKYALLTGLAPVRSVLRGPGGVRRAGSEAQAHARHVQSQTSLPCGVLLV